MVVDQATREWAQLKSKSCGRNFEQLKLLVKSAFQTYKTTSKEGYLLVNRAGHVQESSPDPLEFCYRTIYLPDVQAFTKLSLYAFLGGSIKSHAPRKIYRLVRKFRLDSAHVFYADNPLSVQIVSSEIADSRITNDHITQIYDLDLWIPELQDRYFQKREQNVQFEKLAFTSDSEKKRALSVELEFSSQQIRNHSSPAIEMKGLADTLEIEVPRTMGQKLNKPNPGSFIGSGKLEEILEAIEEDDYTHLLFNCDIPSKFKRELDTQSMLKVWDRTDLILEIFRVRSRTERAKLQVELASLHYRGEDTIRRQLDDPQFASAMAYETYRDKLRQRLTEKKKAIKQDLERLKRQDAERRSTREISSPTSIALVGYTNAGKSSLFNKFLGREEVATENLLFKTLDTTTRNLEISKQSAFLISDTVGFIQQMPEHLKEAFHTTLAESKLCSHLLILLDPTSISIKQQIECIIETLGAIDRVDQENWFWVVNKTDLLDENQIRNIEQDFKVDLFISAHDQNSVESLKEHVVDRISSNRRIVTLELDYSMNDEVHALKNIATILEEPIYDPDWIRVKISFPFGDEYKIEQLFGASLEELGAEETEQS